VTAGAQPERPDLRLVLPALAAWGGAFAGLGLPPAWSLALGVPIAVTGALGIWRATARAGPREPAAVLAGAAVATCAAAGLLAAASRVAAAGQGPLPGLAAQRAAVVADVVVTGDPRPLAARARGAGAARPAVLVRARAEFVEARGRRHAIRSAVVIFARDERWLSVVPGQRVRAVGRLASPGSHDGTSAALTAAGPPSAQRGPPLLQRAADRLRDGLREAVSGLPDDQRGLVPALVVGDTTGMPAGLVEDFRAAGLTHLTAVSGANLMIVCGAVLVAARFARVRIRAAVGLAGLAMLGFVVLARPEPSVLRAAAMGAVGLLALASGRGRRGLPALCAAGLVLVLVDPWLARSYGFALSVLATGGLLVLAPAWSDRLARRLPRLLADALAIPAAAHVVCAPVVVLLSAQVSMVAVPANLLAAPAVAPATILGVLATVTAVVAPPLAAVFGQLAGLAAGWIVVVGERAAAIPGAAVDWPAGLGGALLLAGLTLTAALAWPVLRRRRTLGAAAVAVLAVLVARPGLPPTWTMLGWPPRGWVMVACEVGQGDMLVLRAGDRTAVVVDTGPDPRAADRCLRRLGVRRVPYVLLSHFHADHVAGLPGVLRGRRVAEIGVAPLREPADQAAVVARVAADQRVPVTVAVPDEVRQAGPVQWRVLWPRRIIRTEGSAPNNSSVVVLAELAGLRLLLTGDVEPVAQRALLGVERDLRADVLKVPHHGSAYQEPRLLRAVDAQVALISVGADNDYGHPAPATLALVQSAGAQVARTDRDGDVAVLGPAGRLRVVWSRGRGPAAARSGSATDAAAAIEPRASAARLGTLVRSVGGPCDAGSRCRRQLHPTCSPRSLSCSGPRSCSLSAPSPRLSRPRAPPTRRPMCGTSPPGPCNPGCSAS
jgi:competence protein ComEC